MAVRLTGYVKYYKFLISNFGHADCKGCLYLAKILDKYEPDKSLQEIYQEYSAQTNSTAFAIARNVRTYIDLIMKDNTVEDISKLLDYQFKPGVDHLTQSELIPAIKFDIDYSDNELE